ncbi:MAG: hypothetical protein IPJ26_13750 [Bacteroidetes bacterium]|nr:hypothetical protein [Bacteroidota bacterium]
MKPTSSKEAFAKFIHSKMEELKVAITEAKMHRQEVGNRTDILGALEVAQSRFNANFNNSIVIMSDMEQLPITARCVQKEKHQLKLSQTADVKYSNITQLFNCGYNETNKWLCPKHVLQRNQNLPGWVFTTQGVKSMVIESPMPLN